jgi:hypothetical protein
MVLPGANGVLGGQVGRTYEQGGQQGEGTVHEHEWINGTAQTQRSHDRYGPRYGVVE